jgi:hypothetical protein
LSWAWASPTLLSCIFCLPAGDLSHHGERYGALQPQPLQRREGVSLAPGHLGGGSGRAVELRNFYNPAGANNSHPSRFFKPLHTAAIIHACRICEGLSKNILSSRCWCPFRVWFCARSPTTTSRATRGITALQ